MSDRKKILTGKSLDSIDAFERFACEEDTIPAEPRIGEAPLIDESGESPKFSLLKKLGEGGFGEVWRARQDEPIRRVVAVKLLKKDFAGSREMAARFRAEQQALALLDHPSVAKVFHAGRWEDGRLFFAMELVGRQTEDGGFEPGKSLTAYCDHEKLGIKKRLSLFLQVCQAIQHAHDKGLIHRDLKPSNILIGEADGAPILKVIDFGIAKILDPQLFRDVLLTEQGQLIGTPQYMSPEQASGDPGAVGTGTDLYSLGALLYELLCGTPPIDRDSLRQSTPEEVLRKIREEEPLKPSERARAEAATNPETEILFSRGHTDSRPLLSELRGELDWIAMRALEKEPERRYESANQLGADVKARIEDLPIPYAGPPSFRYRMKKFVRRNRGSVAAAALFVCLLIAGTVTSTWQALEARQAEMEQSAARVEAEAVSDFLATVFQSPHPEVNGRSITVAEMLDSGARKLEGDSEISERHRAALKHALGRSYVGLGLGQEATPLLEDAVKYFEAGSGESDPSFLQAATFLAEAYRLSGKSEESAALHERILSIKRREFGEEAPETLRAQVNLAVAYTDQGQYEKAEAIEEATLPTMKKVLGEFAPDTLRLQMNRAMSLVRQGKIQESLVTEEKLLEAMREVFKADHPDILKLMSNLAAAYALSDRSEEALALREEVLEKSKVIAGEDSPVTIGAINNLAISYRTVDRPEDAIALLEGLPGQLIRKYGPDHPVTILAICNLGLGHYEAGDPVSAVSVLEPHTERFRKVLKHDHPITAIVLRDLLWAQRQVHGIQKSATLLTITELSEVYQQLGKSDECLALRKEAMLPISRVFGSENPNTLFAMTKLATSYRIAGQIPNAVKLQEASLIRLREKMPPLHPWLRISIANLAECYSMSDRNEEAEALKAEVRQLDEAAKEQVRPIETGDSAQ